MRLRVTLYLIYKGEASLGLSCVTRGITVLEADATVFPDLELGCSVSLSTLLRESPWGTISRARNLNLELTACEGYSGKVLTSVCSS